uniref:Cytochrome c oxidase subunit 2 n=1 Tax=Panopea generosa TaxID=1049056 RepID=A0A0U1XM78_9BIVA|nr:cytochrome c oxidase subunit II [Panopea generosa]AIU56047.1 cytochrome c oxidase subunit II [Panopea generosa]
MSYWGQLMFQDSASLTMKNLVLYHNLALLVLVFIMSMVGYFLVIFVFNGNLMRGLSCRNSSSNELLESLWTLFPVVWLLFLAGPSLKILYLMEMYSSEYGMSLKVIGHQWYWSYDYVYSADSFMKGKDGELEFDSYMVPTSDLGGSNEVYRLLEVDSRFVLPSGENIRVLVGSEDVMHCWTLPSLGLKVDAVPGRLNMLTLKSNHVGVVYGQCSEICGANHSFMPIVGEFISPKMFDWWWLCQMS